MGILGSAAAEAAEGAGAVVARLDRVQAGLQGSLVFEGLDLTDETATALAMAKIEREMGKIDGLVNIAGGFTWACVADAPAHVWETMFRINVVTAVTATRAALEALRRSGGSIVNIGANAAGHGTAGMAAYAASKSGVARLTEALAEELAADGVRVNAILPSIIDTPANRIDMPDADFGSWVTPLALARVILFLLSDAAAAITGATIPVTRGTGAR
jgi:NAD(P)-dependent dehydrogenase (short-subunit alcohol dehydrogenase family)